MTDSVYKKQLEKFGIESTRAVDPDPRKLQKAADLEAKIAVTKAIMNSYEGRQWIYNKLDVCSVFTAPIVPGDPYGTHVLAGIQSVGQMLLNDIIEASPEQFTVMLQEAAVRKLNY